MSTCQNPTCRAALQPPRRKWCCEKCAKEAYNDKESAEIQARRQAWSARCPDCSAVFGVQGVRGRPPERCPKCRLHRSRLSRSQRLRI